MNNRAKLLVPDHPRIRTFVVSSKFLYAEDLRFDATTYSQSYYQALNRIQRCPYKKADLGTLVRRIYHPTENQARSNFKRIWVAAAEGLPFLTGRQLFFFRPEREKFISRQMPKLDELLVPSGTILLSRSGTTGFPVLVGDWLSQFAVTDDAIRLFPGKERIGFVYAFLASETGRALLTKNDYGSTVSHLEAKHVAALQVPLLPEAVRQAVDGKVQQAVRVREAARHKYDDAERRMYEALGVSPFSEADIEYFKTSSQAKGFSIQSCELGERFDATHHVPVARSAVHKLSSGSYPTVRLGDRVAGVDLPPRLTRIKVEETFGIPLLQGSHIPLQRINELKYVSRTQTAKITKWLIKQDWVLITRSGTVGRSCVVTKRQDGWVGSDHIIRVRARAGVSHPGFLCCFIGTPFGQHQLYAKIYGGVVDELTPEDTADVLIPDTPFSVQDSIGQAVVEAYEMRDEALALEDRAVADLEDAIGRET